MSSSLPEDARPTTILNTVHTSTNEYFAQYNVALNVQYACAHSVTLNCYSERVQHRVSVCNGALHRGARQHDASNELEREYRADYLCAAQCNANTSVCSCSLRHLT